MIRGQHAGLVATITVRCASSHCFVAGGLAPAEESQDGLSQIDDPETDWGLIVKEPRDAAVAPAGLYGAMLIGLGVLVVIVRKHARARRAEVELIFENGSVSRSTTSARLSTSWRTMSG